MTYEKLQKAIDSLGKCVCEITKAGKEADGCHLEDLQSHVMALADEVADAVELIRECLEAIVFKN